MPFLRYTKPLQTFARQLRSSMTEQENLLWYYIRKRQIRNIQFFRQRPIESYIVDFYAPSVKLVIEVDGCQHSEPEMLEQDQIRDSILCNLGLHVLRFENIYVEKCLDLILIDIEKYIDGFHSR